MTHTGGSTESLAQQAAEAFSAQREGDPDGMARLVDVLTPLLWHTARAQGLTRAQAEDVVQTTWLQLVKHREAITDARGILKWLITTTRRESWAVVRRSRREDITDDLGEVLDGAPATPDGPEGPEQLVVRGQEQRVLWQHFAALSARCQQLLRVIALAERPDYGQVAEALGMPVGSIGPTRGRCLAKLRQALTSDPAWEVTA
jgi:RNA polymerase sigma factor (sigma-70 family)